MFFCGSSATKKSVVLQRTVLPFVANELFAQIQQRRQHADEAGRSYRWQLEVSCFEIQDEGEHAMRKEWSIVTVIVIVPVCVRAVVTDLLRPANRGLDVTMSADEGVAVRPLHKQPVAEEMVRSLPYPALSTVSSNLPFLSFPFFRVCRSCGACWWTPATTVAATHCR